MNRFIVGLLFVFLACVLFFIGPCVCAERTPETDRFHISISKSGLGTVDPPKIRHYTRDESPTVTWEPSEGESTLSVTIDEVVLDDPEVGTYEFPGIEEDHTFVVKFTESAWVLVETDGMGTVDPTGLVPVQKGEDLHIDFSADEGYEVHEVFVDDVAQGLEGARHMTLEDVEVYHEILVVFVESPYIVYFYTVATSDVGYSGTWTPSSGSRWSKVDEVTGVSPTIDQWDVFYSDNDGTVVTYVSGSTAYLRWGMTALDLPAEMTEGELGGPGVGVWMCNGGDSGYAYIKPTYRIGSTFYTRPYTSPPYGYHTVYEDYGDYGDYLPYNQAINGAWTIAGVESVNGVGVYFSSISCVPTISKVMFWCWAIHYYYSGWSV